MTTTTVVDELGTALAEHEFDGAAVGVDLGTTKNCIAVACFEETIDEPGHPEDQIAALSVQSVQESQAHRWPCWEAASAYVALVSA